MATLLKVGEMGRARFMDGAWGPSDPPTVGESAARAGAGGDGSTLLFSTPKTDENDYELHERTDPLGNKTLHLFSKRKVATAINPNGSQTADAENRVAEEARLKAINARNKAYWDRPTPPRAA